MSRWRLPLTCLCCGAECEHVNGTANGVLAVTIVRCGSCNREYEVTSRMRVLVKTDSERRHKYVRSAA